MKSEAAAAAAAAAAEATFKNGKVFRVSFNITLVEASQQIKACYYIFPLIPVEGIHPPSSPSPSSSSPYPPIHYSLPLPRAENGKQQSPLKTVVVQVKGLQKTH